MAVADDHRQEEEQADRAGHQIEATFDELVERTNRETLGEHEPALVDCVQVDGAGSLFGERHIVADVDIHGATRRQRVHR